MSDKTLTSANSVFTISQSSLFPAPVQLQGYAADKAWSTEALELAETLMGVDGILSAGYVPNPVKQTVTLQADSDSKEIFDTIIMFSKARRETFFLNGEIILPSTGEVHTLTRGVLTTAKQIPDGQKILQPIDYVITWNDVDGSPL